MLAVALALGSAALWGVGDFLGGFFTRKHALASVVLLSQAAGIAALLVLAGVAGLGVNGRAFAVGFLGGLCGGVGLVAYYRALATGTMSIVSPVAACGALVPFGLALAGGERPSPLSVVGAGVAFTGAVLASFHEHRGGGAARRAVSLAVVTALMFGGLLYLLGRASEEGGSFPALLGARAGSLVLVSAWALAVRPLLPRGLRIVVPVAIVGILGTAANGLYALASERGLLSIVSVIASLSPILTVVLAYSVLGERLFAVQRLGVVLALAGVALVVAGT
jgi:uncharacterized membrane protein